MAKKTYLRVTWLHSSPDDPVDLWSELDVDRDETRKVEIWADGRVGYASADHECCGTRLGEGPLPSFDEIAANPEFEPEVITQSQFEDCWAANVG